MNKIICGIIIISLSSCLTFLSNDEIIDFDNEYKEILLSDDTKIYVYNLYLNIYGEIDREIEIEYGDGEFFRKVILSKENNQYIYHSDYYSNKIYLRIYPNNSKGKLKIKYYGNL